MGSTKVVNKKFDYFDEYIGRGSKFGNPFVVGQDGDLQDVLAKYYDWFHRKLRKKRFKLAVDNLRGKRLGCFCRPSQGFQGNFMCHGQIIWAYLEGKSPEECP